MNKPCAGMDEAIFQLAHNQLGFWNSIRVRFHVARCPNCRKRLSRYASLSQVLALALASPSGPPHRLPISRGGAAKGAMYTLLLVVIIGSFWSIYRTASADSVPPPAKSAPCDPAGASLQHKRPCSQLVTIQ